MFDRRLSEGNGRKGCGGLAPRVGGALKLRAVTAWWVGDLQFAAVALAGRRARYRPRLACSGGMADQSSREDPVAFCGGGAGAVVLDGQYRLSAGPADHQPDRHSFGEWVAAMSSRLPRIRLMASGSTGPAAAQQPGS